MNWTIRFKKVLGRSDEMQAQPLGATDCGVAGNADGYVVSTNGTETTIYRILVRQTARFRNEPNTGPSTVFDSLEEAKETAVAIVDQAISNAERQNISAVAQRLLRARLETQTKYEIPPWAPSPH